MGERTMLIILLSFLILQRGMLVADEALHYLMLLMKPAQLDLLAWVLDLVEETLDAQLALPPEKRAVRGV